MCKAIPMCISSCEIGAGDTDDDDEYEGSVNDREDFAFRFTWLGGHGTLSSVKLCREPKAAVVAVSLALLK